MNLEDLGIPSITDMSNDQAIEYLRLIRLARRNPVKTEKQTQAIKKKAESKSPPKLSPNEAAELLKLLEEI